MFTVRITYLDSIDEYGYVRLICSDCQKELNAEIIQPEKKEQKNG